MDFGEFWGFLLSEECFNQHDVSFIDHNGNQHYIKENDYYSYMGSVSDLMGTKYTVKVEQMERKFEVDGTAHMFYNVEGSPSFGVHTDPVDVVIKCCDGIKHMEVNGETKKIAKGESIRIPAGTEHKAVNTTKALMISYGILDTETLNRIR